MTQSARLQQIRNRIEGWRGQLDARRDPPWELAHSAKLPTLLTEAKEVIRKALGPASAYYSGLPVFWLGNRGVQRQPEDHEIRQCLDLIDAAIRDMLWEEERKVDDRVSPGPAATLSYVSETTISEIRALPRTNYDFSRLAELCRELNVAAAGGAHMATMILVRAIIDHVPPSMGGYKTFAEFAAQSEGTRSFKALMTNLDTAFRKAADGHLHTTIRRRESVPTAEEADHRTSLGELLRAIVSRHRDDAADRSGG